MGGLNPTFYHFLSISILLIDLTDLRGEQIQSRLSPR